MTATTAAEQKQQELHEADSRLIAMGLTDPAARAQVRAVGMAWPYYIRPLAAADIPAMQKLQEASGDGQVLPRTAETLTAHFNAGNKALGAFHQGRLVAQSLISTGPATANLPVKGALTACFMTQSLMGGVIVGHEARGRGLMEMMVKIWLAEARKDGIDIAHARVRTGNEKSWQVFMRNGLAITGIGPSPDQPHHDVFFLHKPLQSSFALQDDAVAPANQRGDITGWLKRGYVATTWQPQTRHFTLARPLAGRAP